MTLTREWLLANGFTEDRLMGFVRELSRGPADTRLLISLGTFPANAPCVAVWLGGFGMVANVESDEDIVVLIRLLDGAYIEHPYEMEVDLDQEDASA